MLGLVLKQRWPDFMTQASKACKTNGRLDRTVVRSFRLVANVRQLPYEDADTVVIFCTGHRGHVLNPHLAEFDALMKKGTGVVMIHWATEAEKGEPGKKFLDWMGGFCDLDWSVNPHWAPNFKTFPDHPISNGVKPFKVNDEWYYHMRFVDDMKGVLP